MAYHTATTSIAVSVGSLMGGFAGTQGYKFAFFTQFILCLIVGLVIYLLVDETIEKKPGKIRIYTKHLTKGKNSVKLDKTISTMMVVMTLITIATTSYNSTINYYVDSVLHMPTTVNGVVMACAGVISLIMNLWINPYLSRKFDEKNTLIVAGIIAGLSMLLASIFSNIITSFLFIMVFVGSSALVVPIQQSIITKLSKDNYGEIMGIQGSYKAIGMIIGSLVSGFIFDFGNKLPFILSGLCCLIMCLIITKVCINSKNNKISATE